MMQEEWRKIDGFHGHYEVSNLGRVRRIEYICPKTNRFYEESIKTQGFDKDGYATVVLYDRPCNIKKLCKVHRLVAIAFIENPEDLPMINHKNEDKSDNRVENLEWCNCLYNNNYGTRNKRMSETKRQQHKCYAEKGADGRFIRKLMEV